MPESGTQHPHTQPHSVMGSDPLPPISLLPPSAPLFLAVDHWREGPVGKLCRRIIITGRVSLESTPPSIPTSPYQKVRQCWEQVCAHWPCSMPGFHQRKLKPVWGSCVQVWAGVVSRDSTVGEGAMSSSMRSQ